MAGSVRAESSRRRSSPEKACPGSGSPGCTMSSQVPAGILRQKLGEGAGIESVEQGHAPEPFGMGAPRSGQVRPCRRRKAPVQGELPAEGAARVPGARFGGGGKPKGSDAAGAGEFDDDAGHRGKEKAVLMAVQVAGDKARAHYPRHLGGQLPAHPAGVDVAFRQAPAQLRLSRKAT